MRQSVEIVTLPEVPYSASTSKAPSLKDGHQTPSDTKTISPLTESDLIDHTLYLPPRKVALIVVCLGLSFFLCVLETTILATAVPSIAGSFQAGETVSWVITAFLLGSTATTPFWGRLADIFGRKTIMMGSTICFLVSTLACSLAQSIAQLIAFRTIQGFGTSGVGVMGYVILSDIVPLNERGKYQGLIDTICISAQAAGPLVGAILVTKVSWRACFWSLLGPTAVVVGMQWWLLPSRKVVGDWRSKMASIDYMGCFTALSATTLLLVAISRGGIETSWTSIATVLPIVFSIFFCIAFVIWEWKYAVLPIVPVRLFRKPTVVSVHLSTFASMAGHFICTFYIPSFLQIVRGLPIITSGLLVLIYGVGLSLFVFVSVVASRWVGTRPLLITGFALWAAMGGILVTWDSRTSVAAICGTLAFGSVGAGLTVATGMMAAESAVSRSERAVVTGSRNFARLLGASIGTAAGASLVYNDMQTRLATLDLSAETVHTILTDPPSIQSTLRGTLPEGVRMIVIENYVRSYRSLFWIVTGLMLFSFVVSVTLLRSHSLIREDDEEQREAAKVWLDEQKASRKDNKEPIDAEKGQGDLAAK